MHQCLILVLEDSLCLCSSMVSQVIGELVISTPEILVIGLEIGLESLPLLPDFSVIANLFIVS